MSTDTAIRVPAGYRTLYAEKIAEKLIEAGWSASQATTATAQATERLVATLEEGLTAKAANLRNGEGFTVDWEAIANLSAIEVSKPAPAPDAAALLRALKGLQGNVAPKAIAAVPVAAKADTSGGMTPEQLAQLIGAVASAAAQGAATGAQVKPADTTMEITSQDMPVPGQLGRFRKVVRTRRVPSSSMPDLR
jgi:hypothetical protein